MRQPTALRDPASSASIRVDRIQRDIETIAGCTSTPGAGASRPTFSDPWRAACAYVASELDACNCEVRIDCAGNVHARPKGLGWDAPAWLSGSHLDSVPNGGDFDGVAGVVVPLELLRVAHDDGTTDLPLELVVFAEEEGTTFGLGMLGSRTLVGDLSAEQLARLRNDHGQSYLDAGSPCGVRPDEFGVDLLRREAIRGFVEVHVEQGPGLWMRNQRLAVANAIAGRRQYRCRVNGRANHAGSTAMADRHDALSCAAEIIFRLEALAVELPRRSVITVGQIFSRPNSINIIPGFVEFSIDFRSPDNDVLADGHRRIEEIILDVATRRHLAPNLERSEALTAETLDADLCRRLCDAARRVGFSEVPLTISGALHDAAILAPHVPSSMIFVASRDGISHSADEFSRVEDIAAAAEVLQEVVRGHV